MGGRAVHSVELLLAEAKAEPDPRRTAELLGAANQVMERWGIAKAELDMPAVLAQKRAILDARRAGSFSSP